MDEITHSPIHRHDTNESKVIAGSYTEHVHDIGGKDRSHIPEHLRIPVPDQEKAAPTFFSKIGSNINSFCSKFIFSPSMKIIRFLQKRTNLTFWIILAMVIGILVGRFAPAAGKEIKPLGDAFIQMIKIIIVPLVFSVLVIGIAGHGDDIAKVGKLAIKTIIVSKICIASITCLYLRFTFSILKWSLHWLLLLVLLWQILSNLAQVLYYL